MPKRKSQAKKRGLKSKKRRCKCRFGYYPECPVSKSPYLCKLTSPSARNPKNYSNVKKYGKEWRK